MITFDRTSTREELFEVIELLCNNGKSEFTRSPGTEATDAGGRSFDDLFSLPTALSQNATEDEDQAFSGDLRSLEELLFNQKGRLN